MPDAYSAWLAENSPQCFDPENLTIAINGSAKLLTAAATSGSSGPRTFSRMHSDLVHNAFASA